MKTWKKPQLTTVDTYFLMSNLWIDFLNQIGNNNVEIDNDDVPKFIKKMRDEWLSYDIKYNPQNQGINDK